MFYPLGAKIFCVASLLCIALNGAVFAAANEEKAIATSATGDMAWGLDIQTELQHQQFTDSSADLTTITLQPHLQLGNWDFSLDMPWQYAEGGYFVNGFEPAPKYYCQYDPVALKNKRLQRRLIKAQARNCSNTTTTAPDVVSGWGDATAFVRYGLPLDDDGIWLLSLGGGYKFDNGAVDKNLGSGTRDTLLESALSANYGWFSGVVTGGYGLIAAGATTDANSNYAYGSIDLALHPLHWLSVGCRWSYDEAYHADGQNVQMATLYVGLRPLDKFGVRLYIGDYLGADGYPDREYGGSISLSF